MQYNEEQLNIIKNYLEEQLKICENETLKEGIHYLLLDIKFKLKRLQLLKEIKLNQKVGD